MSSPIIRLHVGAHKTATTYIQDVLSLNRDASAAAGTVYWPRERVRAPLSGVIKAEKRRDRSRIARIGSPFGHRHKTAIAEINKLLRIDYDVTVSEENALGEAHDGFAQPFYQHAETYLGVIKAALPDRPLEILIAVRSYDSFTSSLYCEALSHGRFLRPEKARSNLGSLRGTWPHLLSRIQSLFPSARMIVWPYERFQPLEDILLSRLSGLEVADLEKPGETDTKRSPSGAAIESFIEEAEQLTEIERRVRMRALRGRYPRSKHSETYSLWSAQEAERLREDYAHDLEAIKAGGDVEFLS